MRVATPVTAPKAWARRLKVGEGSRVLLRMLCLGMNVGIT